MSKFALCATLVCAMLSTAPSFAATPSHQKAKKEAALIRYLERPVRYAHEDSIWSPGFGARICEPGSHYYATEVCRD